MPLTDHEREFLAAFINEVTTDPFKGPVTEELHRRDIFYNGLSHLMAAYYRENPPHQEGFGGKPNRNVPACPWRDREAAILRDRQVEAELKKTVNQTVSS